MAGCSCGSAAGAGYDERAWGAEQRPSGKEAEVHVLHTSTVLQQIAWSEALRSFAFCTSVDNAKVTIHHLISQAGWNRCNLSIYLSCMST